MRLTRLTVAAFIVTCLAGLFFMLRPRGHETPLDGNARFKADRSRAIRGGLNFIVGMAHDPKVFKRYGADLLLCLYGIASTSADSELSQTAWEAAGERAREYRRLNPALPSDARAVDVYKMASGSCTADLIGVPADVVKEQVRRAAARFSPQDSGITDGRKPCVPRSLPGNRWTPPLAFERG